MTPQQAITMPRMFIHVTGFPRMKSEIAMTKIRFDALATA
jgi:hypothetical protein